MTPKQLFLANLGTINDAIAFVCRRHAVKPEDAEDLTSAVRLHLIADDYRVLAEFRGECSIETYLGVIVQRCWADFRRQRWGRWRISAAARRLGQAAVVLEGLVFRDGLSIPEANRQLRVLHGIDLSADEAETIVGALPARPARREVSAAEIPSEPATDSTAERELLTALARSAIADGLARFPRQDRLLLRLHFEDGLPLTAIATSFGIAVHVLRRRYKKCLGQLRQALAGAGVVASTDIEELLISHLDLDFGDDQNRHSPDLRPSLLSEVGASGTDDASR